VGQQTVGAILDAVFQVSKVTAAVITQAVQRAIAEQAAEGFRVRTPVAGKIFAFLILKEIIVRHIVPP
jgi:hypothetical protein